MNNTQNPGSINQTQNPQSNTGSLFSENKGVQTGNSGSFNLNTSSTSGSIDLNTVPPTISTRSTTWASSRPTNFTPYVISGSIFILVIAASVIFMKTTKL